RPSSDVSRDCPAALKRKAGLLTASGNLSSVARLASSVDSQMPSCNGGPGIDVARRLLVPAATLLMCLSLLICSQGPGAPPPPPRGAIPAGQSIGDAAIEGRVTFAGPPPPRHPIRMTSEAACHKPGSEALTEDVVVSLDGALKNARVHVVSGLGDRDFATPQEPPVRAQSGCADVQLVLPAR